jgi:glycosyltransferase involved in cell wall biosynthesis
VIYEIHEFPELLALRGHEVTFIDFAEGYRGKPGGNQRTWKQKGRVYRDAEITIHSPWLSGVFSIDRLVALFTVWSVLWKLRKQDFDVILNYAVPTYGIQVNLWARTRKIPVIHRALDVSHKIRESFWNPLIELLEKFVFRLSSAISTNNPAMLEYVRSTSEKLKEVAVHYPPTFNADWRPESFSDDLARSLGIKPGDIVLGYLGSFFYFSGLPSVLDGIARYSQEFGPVKLLLVGGGEQEALLRQLASDLQIEEKVIFTGFIDFCEIPKYLPLFDVGLNPMEPLAVSNFALPNKVIQYLAMGLPVVSTELLGLKAALGNCPSISWVNKSSEVFEAGLRTAMANRKQVEGGPESRGCVSQFETSIATNALEAFLVARL